MLVHKHLLSERPQPGERGDGFAPIGETRRLTRTSLDTGAKAKGRAATETVHTGSAERGEARDDVIADGYPGHPIAHGLDDARSLMPQDGWRIEKPLPLKIV
jgi:hypothetical protein